MSLPAVETASLISFLSTLLNTPSPTGLSEPAITLVEQAMLEIPGWRVERTRKGALLATLPGERSDQPRALSAHVDTLGAMVKEIKPNGRLKMTQLGGYAWNAVEGEGCTIFTQDGKTCRGSILIDAASSHVYAKKVGETPRDEDHLEVRLDERSASADETRSLAFRWVISSPSTRGWRSTTVLSARAIWTIKQAWRAWLPRRVRWRKRV